MTMGESRKAAIRDMSRLRRIARSLYHVDINERSRLPEIVRVRHLVMYALWHKGHSYSAIGDAIDRHHTTVMVGVARVIDKGRTEEARRLLAHLSVEAEAVAA